MDLTHRQLSARIDAAIDSPTELERMFWRWIGGDAAAGDEFWEEVQIVDLRGPGHLPLEEA